MMKIVNAWAVVLVALSTFSTASAEEKATDDRMPASLTTIGIGQESVLSAEAAKEVRGRVTLMSGVTGQFRYIQHVPGPSGDIVTSMVIEGQYGGQQGLIAFAPNNFLVVNVRGKAFQQTLDFVNPLPPEFSTNYGVPLLSSNVIGF